jgi:hypothetical protein
MARQSLNLDPPYSETLKGILNFADFAEAESTISNLDAFRRKYHSAGDAKGVRYCREIARIGRHRAELISRNPRVNSHKRLQKQEMAIWFRIWLETPEIFEIWLDMRKRTSEFQMLLQPDLKKKSPRK